jgi:RNA polymerase sigma-70 factor (ECF subfamily)
MRASRTHPPDRDLPADEALMRRYADGDPDAFDALFRRHERRAYAYFLKRTGSPERAQDLYQELFLRIHRARDRYDPSRPFLPWFFQIASRLLVDDLRKAFRSREVDLGAREPSAPDAGRDRVAERETLERALGALSADERYVLISSRVEGVGYPELARRLGKSVDAVKKMASRAVQRVRRIELAEAPG